MFDNLRHPYLLLLGLIPLALLVFFWIRRRSAKVSSLNYYLVPAAQLRSWRIALWWLPELLTLVALMLWVLALAGPQRSLDPDKQEGQGLAIALVIDRSGSMQAELALEGKKTNRLEAVKEVTRRFIEARPDDAFALISFARYPETHTPLTVNSEVLRDFVDLIRFTLTEADDGTAIGDSLVLALARLKALPPKQPGIIILLTDGQQNAGEAQPEEAARLAAQRGVPIYSLGLGATGMVSEGDVFGSMLRNFQVNVDEASLRSISEQTGGRYISVNRMDDLQPLLTEIAQNETLKLERSRPPSYELRIESLLMALLVLLVLLPLLGQLVLGRRQL